MIEVRDGRLIRGDDAVDAARVLGFHERFDGLTGRAWLEIVGPGWTIPMDAAYGAVRKALREAFPDRPFTSDWADGRFPSAPGGWPPELAFGLGVIVAIGATVAIAASVGPLAGAAVAIACGWPVGRLRDGVVVRRAGVRVGAAWAPMVPWHEVTSISAVIVGRRVVVRLVSDAIGGQAAIPPILLPALRARVWRIGGVAVDAAMDPLDWRYSRWRGPATGIPWGILAATLVITPFLAQPWRVLAAGLLATAATAMLGAAVEARATGWGSGAIAWSTGVYAVVLVAFSLALWGF